MTLELDKDKGEAVYVTDKIIIGYKDSNVACGHFAAILQIKHITCILGNSYSRMLHHHFHHDHYHHHYHPYQRHYYHYHRRHRHDDSDDSIRPTITIIRHLFWHR